MSNINTNPFKGLSDNIEKRAAQLSEINAHFRGISEAIALLNVAPDIRKNLQDATRVLAGDVFLATLIDQE